MCVPESEDLSFLVESLEENLVDILKDKNNIEVKYNSWVVKNLVDLIVDEGEMSYGDGIGRGYQEAKEQILLERGEVDRPLYTNE